MPDFSVRSRRTELLDTGRLSERDVRASLSDMRRINRIFGSRRILLETIAAEVERRGLKEFSLLDIASGSADLPLAIFNWAASRGIHAEVFAMEFQQNHLALFRLELTSLHLICGDALRAPIRARSMDFVTCCNFFHHLDEREASELLSAMASWARCAVVISDLERHWLPYYFFWLVSPLLSTTPVTQIDGCASIAQSFCKPELEQIARSARLHDFTVTKRWPFRLLTVVDTQEAFGKSHPR